MNHQEEALRSGSLACLQSCGSASQRTGTQTQEDLAVVLKFCLLLFCSPIEIATLRAMESQGRGCVIIAAGEEIRPQEIFTGQE